MDNVYTKIYDKIYSELECYSEQNINTHEQLDIVKDLLECIVSIHKINKMITEEVTN